MKKRKRAIVDMKRTKFLGWTVLAVLTLPSMGALAQTRALDVLAGKRFGMLKVPPDGNFLYEMLDR
jgi:hypothetical protein